MNNDLISREALKKALKSNCDLCHDKNTNWCEHCCPLNDFEDLIDNAPTVIRCSRTSDGLPLFDLTPRSRGEWIIHNSFDGWVECPFCHVGRTVFEKLPKFCENCGADMRGGAE